MISTKKTKRAFDPSNLKITKSSRNDVIFAEGKPLCWKFSIVDKNGAFSWSKLDDPIRYKKVIERLYSFEDYNSKTILNNGCHFIPFNELSTEAKKRLAEIFFDDIDGLYSLRISGKERVFCVLDVNIMKVLWWDPEHKVCISHKKHT